MRIAETGPHLLASMTSKGSGCARETQWMAVMWISTCTAAQSATGWLAQLNVVASAAFCSNCTPSLPQV